MPELPEVETIVRQLQIYQGRDIKRIEVLDGKVVEQAVANLKGNIEAIRRRGKSIIFDFKNIHLLIHLRMTGHFTEKKTRYTSAVFHLDKGKLYFNTIRRFSTIQLLNKNQLRKKLSTMGPEPFSMTEREFLARKSSKANIKNKLLDQSFIAGVGNIYAQEAMYNAGIDPKKSFTEVQAASLLKLRKELNKVLKAAIANNGSTVDNYSNMEGAGEFQNLLKVYRKDSCPKGHAIQKINIGGRGTYFCPVCQC